MREIKYRAISECQREGWLYGYPRHYCHNPHTEKWTIYDSYTRTETDVIPETIGQFTGLQDENGKEIYEGDVLLYNKMKLFVKWRQEDCRYVLIGLHDKDYFLNAYKCNIEDYFKVIGNIHDNPELLKGGEK